MPHFCGAILFCSKKGLMYKGNLYFLTDEYYDKFPDCGLMGNKEDGRGRPCVYCFEYDGIRWMIPISSKIEKYKDIYKRKKEKYGKCDSIRFGYVNGKERAFLLQNICPTINKYIACPYMLNGKPAKIPDDFSKELNSLARKIIRLYKKGIKTTLSDISYILDHLEE